MEGQALAIFLEGPNDQHWPQARTTDANPEHVCEGLALGQGQGPCQHLGGKFLNAQ